MPKRSRREESSTFTYTRPTEAAKESYISERGRWKKDSASPVAQAERGTRAGDLERALLSVQERIARVEEGPIPTFTLENPDEIGRPKKLWNGKGKPPAWWSRPNSVRSFCELYETSLLYDFVSTRYKVDYVYVGRRRRSVVSDELDGDYAAHFRVRDHLPTGEHRFGSATFIKRTRTVPLRDWWSYHLGSEDHKKSLAKDERVTKCQ